MALKVGEIQFDNQNKILYHSCSFCSIYVITYNIYFQCAFKPMDELFAYPPRFLVRKPSLVNFRTLFRITN